MSTPQAVLVAVNAGLLVLCLLLRALFMGMIRARRPAIMPGAYLTPGGVPVRVLEVYDDGDLMVQVRGGDPYLASTVRETRAGHYTLGPLDVSRWTPQHTNGALSIVEGGQITITDTGAISEVEP